MSTILDTIVARVREDLEEEKQRVPLEEMQRRAEAQPPARDFFAAIYGSTLPGVPNPVKLIAEVKKASPSKGLLCPDFDPVRLARTYEAGGASAISVLTEPHFFQGALEHLTAVRGAVALPVLRKDFIVDPYQVYQARAAGADAILLICAVLEDAQLGALLDLAHQLGMHCLVEVHDASEVRQAVACGARIIGINNRDLRDFHVDIRTTRDLRSLIPDDRLVVSESGLHHAQDVRQLADWRVQALLVGEALVTARDRAAKVRELSQVRVKICGIRSSEQAREVANAGAAYIGLIFYPPSKRYVTPDEATAITRLLRMRAEARLHAPKTVGVFVNEPPHKINALVREYSLDLVQLSGDESPAVCQAIDVPVLKAVRPHTEEDLEALEAYRPGVLAFLLDTFVPGSWGGTGQVGDWLLAREMAQRYPTMLAGGLTPENVGGAIEAVQPWGVDVSSGVETDGQKDLSKIQAFISHAQAALRTG
jgi:indole-3-glycerol phosphate synthase/phosphoribosylanthranilate isomerase